LIILRQCSLKHFYSQAPIFISELFFDQSFNGLILPLFIGRFFRFYFHLHGNKTLFILRFFFMTLSIFKIAIFLLKEEYAVT